uniref:Uncharacterized protein n=1 Tax=Arundo donax TaxID=35708 RepID=A0A0A9FNB8_ARUDO
MQDDNESVEQDKDDELILDEEEVYA